VQAEFARLAQLQACGRPFARRRRYQHPSVSPIDWGVGQALRRCRRTLADATRPPGICRARSNESPGADV
jgi:hypothetical protein